MNFHPGIVGKYLISSKIGAGANSSVFKAKAVAGDASVALQIFDRSLCRQEEFLLALDRETAGARLSSHENILPILDCGRWNGCAYIVSELFPHASLFRIRESGARLDANLLGAIALQICDALLAAHRDSSNVWHPGLTPKSILIGTTGTVKVRGFITRWDRRIGRPNLLDEVCGRTPFLAPESFTQIPDERSEIYSLGVLLWECLTGHRHVSDDGCAEFAAPKKRENVQTALVSGFVPTLIGELVQRFLRQDPLHRPQTVLHARQELVEVLNQCGLSPEVSHVKLFVGKVARPERTAPVQVALPPQYSTIANLRWVRHDFDTAIPTGKYNRKGLESSEMPQSVPVTFPIAKPDSECAQVSNFSKGAQEAKIITFQEERRLATMKATAGLWLIGVTMTFVLLYGASYKLFFAQNTSMSNPRERIPSGSLDIPMADVEAKKEPPLAMPPPACVLRHLSPECETICEACIKAGFSDNESSQGNGLSINCIQPVLGLRALPKGVRRSLPDIAPELVARCQEAHQKNSANRPGQKH